MLTLSPFLPWARILILGDSNLPQQSERAVTLTATILAVGVAIILLALLMRGSRTAAVLLAALSLPTLVGSLLVTVAWLDELGATDGFVGVGAGPFVMLVGAVAAAVGAVAALVRAFARPFTGQPWLTHGDVAVVLAIAIVWAVGMAVWWFTIEQPRAAQLPVESAPTQSRAAFPSGDASSPTTTRLTVRIPDCAGCAVFADNVSVDPWVSTSADVIDGRAVLEVPTSATRNLGLGLNLPDEGGNAATVVILGFPDAAPGSIVTPGATTLPRRGLTCWAGTERSEVDIYVQLARYPDPQIDGSPGHSGVAYAVPTLEAVGAPLDLDEHGGLSTQELACYPLSWSSRLLGLQGRRPPPMRHTGAAEPSRARVGSAIPPRLTPRSRKVSADDPGAWEYMMTVEKMLAECARSMSGTFSKQEIVSWFRRHYPQVKESTLGAHIQALTSNAPNRERNHPHLASHTPLFDRVGYGLYQVHQPSGPQAVVSSSPPPPPPTPRAVASPATVPPTTARQEWSWEGNVQAAVVAFLVSEGWSVTRVADTASKEHGTDIEAVLAGVRGHVEVKGWPSAHYVDPARAGEQKKTQPATQARVWFADAIVHALRLRTINPGDVVAVALPAVDTYLRLWEGIRPPVVSVGIALLWVAQDGTVHHDGWTVGLQPDTGA